MGNRWGQALPREMRAVREVGGGLEKPREETLDPHTVKSQGAKTMFAGHMS